MRALFIEKRMDGSGQCNLRTTMEGLVPTMSNAAYHAEDLDSGAIEEPNITSPPSTPWMYFFVLWNFVIGLYLRDTSIQNAVQK